MKRILPRLLCAIMVTLTLCTFPLCAQSGHNEKVFADVNNGAWYESGAVYCYFHGYVSGTAMARFSPKDTLTRAMSVQLLYAMEDGEKATSDTYTDVARTKWYFDAVEWAHKNDIAHGTGATGLSPSNEVTRQDFVTMLYRFASAFSHKSELGGTGEIREFTDSTLISDYAKESVEWALSNSLLCGFPDGSLRPKSSITRAEAATVIAAYDKLFGHEWQEQIVSARSCELKGESRFTCSVCQRQRTVVTEAYHIWGEPTITQSAKCFSDGVLTTFCAACTKSYSEPIPAIGHHVMGDWLDEVPASRSVTGVKSRYCWHCGRGESKIYRCDSYYPLLLDGIDLPSGAYELSKKNIGIKVIYTNLALLGTDSASFTNETYNAVKRFQRSCGLPRTGIVDLATWCAMGYGEYDWHNLGRYITPQQASAYDSRRDNINTMINVAWEYANAGTVYRIGCSGPPGTYADCSGLIYQCLYAVGINPDTNIIMHALAEYEYTSRWLAADPKLGLPVSTKALEPGDLVFYAANGKSTVVHVALYAGDGLIYDAWPNIGTTCRSMNIPGYYAIKAIRVFP